MPVTGKSFAAIGPNEVQAGIPLHFDLKEASSQTFTVGAPVQLSAGYVQEMATNASAIKGFAAKAGGNGASDGATTAKFVEVQPGRRFQGTVSVTSATQDLIGSAVALAKASSSWYLATATSLSSIAQCHIEGFARGFREGDSMPEVIFTVDQVAIQYNT